MALAILINCLSPTLRFYPFSVISVISPFLYSIVYFKAVISKAVFNFSSVYSSNGSRFYLRVPANRQGSCKIIVIFDLRSSKLIFAISFPSNMIWPSNDYRILRRPIITVDFPLPVLPTTPILCPPWKVTVSPLRTRSKLGLYFTL